MVNRLRELRQAAGLSQAGLAEKAGLSQQVVSRLESDDAWPSYRSAASLARALGVTVDTIWPTTPDDSTAAVVR